MQSDFEFSLSGLRCDNCVKKVQTLLEKEPQLKVISINQNHVKILAYCSAEMIIQLIEQAGYQAKLLEPLLQADSQESQQLQQLTATNPSANQSVLKLAIEGMSCAQCVNRVTQALASVSGVNSVQVNLADNIAYIDGKANLADLLAASERGGYPARPLTEANQKQSREGDKKTLRRRLWQAMSALIVALLVMAWSMTPQSMPPNATANLWLAIAVLSLIIILTCGSHFFLQAFHGLKYKTVTMDTLVSLSTSTAWLYSTVLVLKPTWFPVDTTHYYFEASMMIIGFINLGQVLEHRARAKASNALNHLLALTPINVLEVSSEGDRKIALNQVKRGMLLRVRSGESIPVDGVLIEGHGTVDESMLTGESWPQKKSTKQRLFAGTLVNSGSFTMLAQATGNDTVLAKIVENVRRAQSSKPSIAKLTDKVTHYFVPSIMFIALFSAAIWWFFGPSPTLSYSLVIFTSVLIIACPCALGLATPMAVIAGISRGANAGILVRDADALQSANRIDTLIFDKTGTLTQGVAQVVACSLLPDWQQQQNSVLTLVAALERNSSHPLANAITAYIENSQLPLVDSFHEYSGKGIVGSISGQKIYLGNLQLMETKGVDLKPFEAIQKKDAELYATHVFIAIDNQPVGRLSIQDPLREEAREVINKLHQKGYKTLMLTGDDSRTASHIAEKVGIAKFIAGVLPQDKAQQVKALQNLGHKVAMVGDGINDAPALAQADLSIAMGSGSDIAVDCADLILLQADLNAIPASLTICNATFNTIKQNLWGAFSYNLLSVPIAAGILYPFTGLLLNPMLASAAMALSSLTVVVNANRLLRLRLK